jgi:predicted nucleic acid-binding protein
MSAAEFLDSNIVVYAYDRRDEHKQRIARGLLKKAVKGECVVSIQVLAEVAVTLLNKVSPPMSAEAVVEILDLLGPIPTIIPDGDLVRRAVQACSEYGVHFYDGMILAAAERAGCRRVWSEDLNPGQEYFGVKVENPFA